MSCPAGGDSVNGSANNEDEDGWERETFSLTLLGQEAEGEE